MTFCIQLLTLVAALGQAHSAMASMAISVVIRLGSTAYYMHQQPEPGLEFASINMIEPVTVFRIGNKRDLTIDHLDTEVDRFRRTDDVWSPAFLATKIIIYGGEEMPTQHEIEILSEKWGTDPTHYLAYNGSTTYHEGPFFLYGGKLHAAYRLYPDTAAAFVVGTVPSNAPFLYKAVDAAAYGEEYPSALSIPVPSRLHFPKSDERPYAGTRIAIKDIIDLAGLKTGGSSRAYTHLYPPRLANAEAVQKLLELGFVVVGKVKTTQFADSEWPTCDWIDYHAPFNPVADGYQTTSGSSAGSAAAIATYEWLDFTLGSDTLGSIRAPATAQGIYGMRSSLGAASFAGVIPYSPYFDTIGAFSRDASSFAKIARAMYGSKDRPKCSKKPSKILYPKDYWPVEDGESQKVFEAYIAKLERHIGVEKSEIDMAKIWQDTNPVKTDKSLQEYFEHVFEWVANPDQWTGFFKAFNEEYEATYSHQPVLNPQLRFKREWLPTTLEPSRQEEGLQLMSTFQEWFENNIIPPAKDGCSEAILVLPWSSGEPDYRDRYRESEQRFTGVGFFFYNISPYARSPELILPAGHTTFKSKVTLKEEQLPVGLGLVSARGSDVFLADLIRDVESSAEVATESTEEHECTHDMKCVDGVDGHDCRTFKPDSEIQQVLQD